MQTLDKTILEDLHAPVTAAVALLVPTLRTILADSDTAFDFDDPEHAVTVLGLVLGTLSRVTEQTLIAGDPDLRARFSAAYAAALDRNGLLANMKHTRSPRLVQLAKTLGVNP